VSNSRVKPKGDVCQAAVDAGAAGLAFLRVGDDAQLDGAKALREGLDDIARAKLLEICGAQAGDLLLFAAGRPLLVNQCALCCAP
jgi:aspartyl-tRNA synthetase